MTLQHGFQIGAFGAGQQLAHGAAQSFDARITHRKRNPLRQNHKGQNQDNF